MNNFGRLGWAFALLGVGGAPEAVTKLDIPRMRAPPPCIRHEPMGAAMGAVAGAGGQVVLPMVRKLWEREANSGGACEERQRSGWKIEERVMEMKVAGGLVSEKSSSLGTVMDPGTGREGVT